MNVENYEKYLYFLMSVIDSKFEDQKEFIKCAKGCSKCCKTVKVPFTDLEFEYLMEGYKQLSADKKEIVKANINKLLNDEAEPSCPFLIDDACAVYKYRGLICRIFGLLIISSENENNIPFCIHDGLNYANVYDEETNKISDEKFFAGGFKSEPKFYPFNRTVMCNLNIVKELELKFGESRELIEQLRKLKQEDLD